jgi:hypothetical protein
MTRDDWQRGGRQLAVKNVQIRTAHSTGKYFHANLPGFRLPIGQLGPFKRTGKLVKYHRVHGEFS